MLDNPATKMTHHNECSSCFTTFECLDNHLRPYSLQLTAYAGKCRLSVIDQGLCRDRNGNSEAEKGFTYGEGFVSAVRQQRVNVFEQGTGAPKAGSDEA